MKSPDPMQRAMLGWPIRWIAGLLVVLFCAAGGLPTNALEASASGLDGPSDSLFASGEDRVALDAFRAATNELLGSKSSSDPELEEEDSGSPAAWTASALAPILAQDLARSAHARSLRTFEACGRRSGRAPPRV